jgi:hypothetical protein
MPACELQPLRTALPLACDDSPPPPPPTPPARSPGASQQEVFEHVRPMVDLALDGVNATVFAYGQTGQSPSVARVYRVNDPSPPPPRLLPPRRAGSGKTYSLEGVGLGGRAGITVRALRHIFAAAAARASQRAEAARTGDGDGDGAAGDTSGAGPGAGGGASGYAFSLSMVEIYQERVQDLLTGVTAEHVAAAVASGGASDASLPPPPSATSGGPLRRSASATSVGGTGRLRSVASAGRIAFGSATAGGGVGVGSADSRWTRDLRAGGSGGAGGDDVTPDNLTLREGADGVDIVGLTRVPVTDARSALEAVRIGTMYRAVGAHALNDRSSRSHMIVRLWVEGPAPTHAGLGARVASVVNLVDLAGSERVLRTGAEGEGLKEAQAINSSLSVLGSVVSGLKKGASHVPFRDSKLTFVLKDSLSGGSKVSRRVCVWGGGGAGGEGGGRGRGEGEGEGRRQGA